MVANLIMINYVCLGLLATFIVSHVIRISLGNEPDECGVKKAHTIGSDGLGAERRCCNLLVGVNCNTPFSGIWWCMQRGLKELIWPPMSPKCTYHFRQKS